MPWLKCKHLYLVLCKLHPQDKRSVKIILMRMLTYKNPKLKWDNQRSMCVFGVGLSVVKMMI